jgi:hypothetical protein
MSPRTLIFIAGLVLGGVVTLVAVRLSGGDAPAQDGREAARLAARNSELEQRLEALEKTVERERVAHREELLAAAAAPGEPGGTEIAPAGPIVPDEPAVPEVPVAGAPPTVTEIEAAMMKFGSSLQSIIMGQGGEAAAEFREFFKRVEAKDLAAILERYGQEDDMGKKIVMAHALAQSGRPEVIEALREIVLDRNNAFTDRRFVAHGLAFVDDPSLQPLLLEVGRNDPDRGVRANASFGLARTGSEEGLSLYAAATDEAFKEKDPAAMQYLSGFYLLGDKALPQVRERLVTYEDPQSRLMLIQLVKQEKDRESLPILQQLERDPKAGQAVQEEARKAIKAIEAPDKGE